MKEQENRQTAEWIPDAPVVHGALGKMPESERAKWTKAYAAAMKQAVARFPEDPSAQAQFARGEANAAIALHPDPASYEEAKNLADWQVIHRDEKDSVLTVVTIDGKRFAYAAPKAAESKPTKATDASKAPQK